MIYANFPEWSRPIPRGRCVTHTGICISFQPAAGGNHERALVVTLVGGTDPRPKDSHQQEVEKSLKQLTSQAGQHENFSNRKCPPVEFLALHKNHKTTIGTRQRIWLREEFADENIQDISNEEIQEHNWHTKHMRIMWPNLLNQPYAGSWNRLLMHNAHIPSFNLRRHQSFILKASTTLENDPHQISFNSCYKSISNSFFCRLIPKKTIQHSTLVICHKKGLGRRQNLQQKDRNRC